MGICNTTTVFKDINHNSRLNKRLVRLPVLNASKELKQSYNCTGKDVWIEDRFVRGNDLEMKDETVQVERDFSHEINCKDGNVTRVGFLIGSSGKSKNLAPSFSSSKNFDLIKEDRDSFLNNRSDENLANSQGQIKEDCKDSVYSKQVQYKSPEERLLKSEIPHPFNQLDGSCLESSSLDGYLDCDKDYEVFIQISPYLDQKSFTLKQIQDTIQNGLESIEKNHLYSFQNKSNGSKKQFIQKKPMTPNPIYRFYLLINRNGERSLVPHLEMNIKGSSLIKNRVQRKLFIPSDEASRHSVYESLKKPKKFNVQA